MIFLKNVSLKIWKLRYLYPIFAPSQLPTFNLEQLIYKE